MEKVVINDQDDVVRKLEDENNALTERIQKMADQIENYKEQHRRELGLHTEQVYQRDEEIDKLEISLHK